MRAMVLRAPAPITTAPLELVETDPPVPGPGEVRVRVTLSGVCRTDLHLCEGDLPPRHPRLAPGHEVVGVVDALGPGASRFAPGERIGIAWLRQTCGACRFCRRGDENLCPEARFTGWDAPGGFADYALVREEFAYRIPAAISDRAAAPLLCAGIIGYRAWRRAEAKPGARVGLYGFGASAHLALQIALHFGCRVYVMTRDERHQHLARELGAAWVGGAAEAPPEPLEAAILFAPAGELVPPALAALDAGGTLAIAGIHLSDVPVLSYQRHLFRERTLRGVTANTRRDGEELLQLAAEIPIVPETELFPLEQANEALRRLKEDAIRGAAVLRVGQGFHSA